MSTLNTSRARMAGIPASPSRRTAPIDEGSLIDAFERLGPALMRWLRTKARPDAAGVTIPRLRLLALLRTSGPTPMGVLARQMGIAPRTLTAFADGLERDGLARRRAHPSDRRATLIEITDAGVEALRACLKPHRAAVAALLRGAFGPADRAALRRLLPKLTDAMDAESGRKG